jgi:multidrug efflux pump subunit AcrA (membrane-fusion protein)
VPGIYAEADLTLEQKDNVLTVPLQAINHQGDGTSVLVVDRQDQLEDRPVTLGLQTANDAEVVSGLSEGEQIVVSDRSGLKPGQKVHPQVVQVMEYQEGAN